MKKILFMLFVSLSVLLNGCSGAKEVTFEVRSTGFVIEEGFRTYANVLDVIDGWVYYNVEQHNWDDYDEVLYTSYRYNIETKEVEEVMQGVNTSINQLFKVDDKLIAIVKSFRIEEKEGVSHYYYTYSIVDVYEKNTLKTYDEGLTVYITPYFDENTLYVYRFSEIDVVEAYLDDITKTTDGNFIFERKDIDEPSELQYYDINDDFSLDNSHDGLSRLFFNDEVIWEYEGYFVSFIDYQEGVVVSAISSIENDSTNETIQSCKLRYFDKNGKSKDLSDQCIFIDQQISDGIFLGSELVDDRYITSIISLSKKEVKTTQITHEELLYYNTSYNLTVKVLDEKRLLAISGDRKEFYILELDY